MANEGAGLAGGLIIAAILDKLLAKDVLSKSEIRDALDKALRALGSDAKTPEGYAASKIIQGMLAGKFSERS